MTRSQNVLDPDDLPVCDEGEVVHAESILSLPVANHRRVLPSFRPAPDIEPAPAANGCHERLRLAAWRMIQRRARRQFLRKGRAQSKAKV